MAAGDAFEAEPQASERSVEGDRVSGVSGTTGYETAARSQHGRDQELVDPDQANEEELQSFHRGLLPAAIRASAWRKSSAIVAKFRVRASLRPISTRSISGRT